MAYGEQCDQCGRAGNMETGTLVWDEYDIDGARCYQCPDCRARAERMIDRAIAEGGPFVPIGLSDA